MLLMRLITHNILKRLWCFHVFYQINPEMECNADMMPLTGDSWTRSVSLVKIAIVSLFTNSWKHLVYGKYSTEQNI